MYNGPKKGFNLRSIWQYRYRFYAVLIAVILSPIFYANSTDVIANVNLPSDQFRLVESNIIASRVQRVQAPVLARAQAPDPGNPAIVPVTDNDRLYIDGTGDEITKELRQAGYDVSYMSAEPFVDLNLPLPVEKKEEVINREQYIENTKKSLNSVKPKPNSPQYTNFLRYPKFNVNSPIIYSSFEDLFNKKPDGSIDFTSPITEDSNNVNSKNALNTPIQRLLVNGIVHLAFTPQPGEIGNSYIVGHSSNFSAVKSNYNQVFKPLESRTREGDEFIIYDRFGRELKFKVFEVKKIPEEDVSEAYKNFPDRRVVTLQTSILGYRNGRLAATHRWLTRGEMVN